MKLTIPMKTGMSAWYNMKTGEKVRRPDAPERPADWYEHHAYRMSPKRVKALAERAKDKLVFLCGIPSNDLDLADYHMSLAGFWIVLLMTLSMLPLNPMANRMML